MSEPKSEPKPWPEFVGNEKRNWMRAGLRFEWVSEHLSYRLGKWAFIEVLEYIGKLGLLGAVILWFFPGCHDRDLASKNAVKTRHYVAWQTLNSAIGKPGDAGRTDALTDLYGDGVSLYGIDLSGGAVFKPGLVLTNAQLSMANFKGSLLEKANLAGANLNGGTLTRMACYFSDFKNISALGTDFSGSYFFGCNFQSNSFRPYSSILTNCNFEFCNFEGASFDLFLDQTGVEFRGCNFVNCYLEVLGRSYRDCNFSNVLDARFEETSQSLTSTYPGSVSVPIANKQAWFEFLDRNGKLGTDRQVFEANGILPALPKPTKGK